MGCSSVRVKSLEGIGFPNYAVREDGVVFHTGNLSWVKPEISSRGYYRVPIYDENNKCKKVSVHRLVAWAFVEGYEDGLIVNHLDNIPSNNHYSNLEWTTHSGNSRHMVDTGRFNYPNKKLSDEEILFIKTSNIKTKQLSEMFNVSKTCIKYHKKRKDKIVFVKEKND